MLRNVKMIKIFGCLRKNVILLQIRYRRFSGPRCTHLSPLISGTFTGETMCINIKKKPESTKLSGKKKSRLFRGGKIGGARILLVSYNLLGETCCTAQDTQAVSEREGIDGQVDVEAICGLTHDIEKFVEEHIVEHTIADE